MQRNASCHCHSHQFETGHGDKRSEARNTFQTRPISTDAAFDVYDDELDCCHKWTNWVKWVLLIIKASGRTREGICNSSLRGAAVDGCVGWCKRFIHYCCLLASTDVLCPMDSPTLFSSRDVTRGKPQNWHQKVARHTRMENQVGSKVSRKRSWESGIVWHFRTFTRNSGIIVLFLE